VPPQVAPTHWLTARAPAVVVSRLAATAFAVLAAASGAHPGVQQQQAGWQAPLAATHAPLLAVWALMHPLEFRLHLPTQLAQLSMVLAGDAHAHLRAGLRTHTWPLATSQAVQCCVGLLLPSLLLAALECHARRLLLQQLRASQAGGRRK